MLDTIQRTIVRLANVRMAAGVFCFALVAFAFPISAAGENETPRERILMDDGWKFYLGDDWGTGENLMKAGISEGPADPTFCDASFRVVNLPHDWAVELPFNKKADKSHGFKPVGKGFPTNSVAWYRRKFTLSKDEAARRVWLEFDGVYRDCIVFVNGYRMGRHESGYDSFRYDITDVANFGGENVVAVRVDASKFEGWWYEGAGIYRHVWLVKTSPLAIAPDGIFVYSRFPNNVPGGPAEVHLETRLQNSSDDLADATVDWQVLDPNGNVVATAEESAPVHASDESTVRKVATVAEPELWSPATPKLYKLVTTVELAGKIIDREKTDFGIRTFAFDPDKGFFLNGKPYVIQGTCNHQDHAGVGIAMPSALQYFRIAKLKEFGCNAIRTSHNEPTPELLDACDRLGMLVMDENRILGSDPENMALLESQVRRDRNHASVFIWSIANEEHVQAAPASAHIAETMQSLVHRLDPTRLVTSAVSLGDVYTGINTVVDVRGWNYHIDGADSYHREHPDQPGIGTEQASTVGTRGIYADDPTHGDVSSYDNNRGLENRAEGWWSFFAARPWLSGGFVWTGFDYRGEPTPYAWPCISSQFGILDTCGFPKANFYYYQSWWTGEPVLHLAPHWNWPGKEGQDIAVWCDSNCQEVELFLNGQSLGRKTMQRNSHLQWTVKYASGVLSAKGYNDGKVVAETKVETTGAPAQIQLTPDRSTIRADGQDVSVITVSVTDADGRIVPAADTLVHFKLNGPGKIIGVGNGDPSCHEPDVYISSPALRSGTMNEWWMDTVSETKHNHTEVAEKFNDTRWSLTDVSSDDGPLAANKLGVFRAHMFLAPGDMAFTNVTIHFGAIKDDGWIYVNGRLAGESHDSAISQSFNLRPYLHEGVNTVAVLVKSGANPGGIANGVYAEMPAEPKAAEWQRSTFNGLAQVLVQSAGQPGQIKLVATSDGLTGTSLVIDSQSASDAE